MGKFVYVFNNDMTERMMYAVGKMMRNQSKLNRNLGLLTLAVAVNAVVQKNTNRYLQDEIAKLKYEVEKLKQQNGD